MVDKLGAVGLVAAAVLVVCVIAAVYQKSIVAIVVGVAAAIFVVSRFLRQADA